MNKLVYFGAVETALACRCNRGAFCVGKSSFSSSLLAALLTAPHVNLSDITSGVRCVLHNDAVGGHPQSKHLSGEAVDISTARKSDLERSELIAHFRRLGFTVIDYVPRRQFLHIQHPKGGDNA